MIAFLRGRLAARDTSRAFIDVGGIGFAVSMAAGDLAKLPEAGGEVEVLTYLQVSDAGIALYGFLANEEKALFERLINVNGVGPKMAMAALSTFTPQALVDAVQSQDVGLVSRIPGVGKKTAQRIILELKGSFEAGLDSLLSDGGADGASVQAGVIQGVREALLSMGFSSAETDLALKGAPEEASEGALLQFALKKLGSA